MLYAADEGAIELHWSREILAEMSRNLRENLGLSHDSTSRLEQLMNDYIEYALIEVDHGDLEVAESVEMDAKDRHVLAAALSAGADILLTDNAKDFPGQWMAEQGMELLATRLVGTCFAGVSASGKRDQPTAGSQSTHRGPEVFAADPVEDDVGQPAPGGRKVTLLRA